MTTRTFSSLLSDYSIDFSIYRVTEFLYPICNQPILCTYNLRQKLHLISLTNFTSKPLGTTTNSKMRKLAVLKNLSIIITTVFNTSYMENVISFFGHPTGRMHIIGLWDRKHQQYIKEYHPMIYSELILSDK